MKLVQARTRDAQKLGRIMAGWIGETPWMPKLHNSDQDTRFLTRLIRENDVIALRNWRGPQGFLARDGEEVHALYLARSVRGKRWGKRLLDHAKARSDRLALWTFQANSGARRFYAREGFRETKLTDGAGNDEKLPDVRLVWTRDEPNP